MKAKEFIKTTKGKIILGFGATCLIICLFIISQYPASTEKVFREYKKNYDVSVFSKYYDGKGIFGKLEKKRALEVIEMAQDDLNMLSISSTGGTLDDRKNVKIEKVEISSLNYSYRSKYTDVNTTIKK